MIFVTGGAGFIGSNFVLDWLSRFDESVLNLDQLTYAGHLENLSSLGSDHRHVFIQGDIGDTQLINRLMMEFHPRAVINFAAESHVDRSIDDPERFMQTNVVGTYRLLEGVRTYYAQLSEVDKKVFRFLHISTDEVYGSLNVKDPPFTEVNRYAPNSPYSASKASADHWVRAYHQTYGLPILTTHSTNNYGPYQFPEKLIPLCILNALNDEPLPIYGDGQQVRDWIFVLDHCRAIRRVLEVGHLGETYNIGGRNEKTNLEVVITVCHILDELRPRADGRSYTTQIRFIQDRLGHDRRYAVDATKIERELGWYPIETFETGIKKTIQWYLDSPAWIAHMNPSICE